MAKIKIKDSTKNKAFRNKQECILRQFITKEKGGKLVIQGYSVKKSKNYPPFHIELDEAGLKALLDSIPVKWFPEFPTSPEIEPEEVKDQK